MLNEHPVLLRHGIELARTLDIWRRDGGTSALPKCVVTECTLKELALSKSPEHVDQSFVD